MCGACVLGALFRKKEEKRNSLHFHAAKEHESGQQIEKEKNPLEIPYFNCTFKAKDILFEFFSFFSSDGH